MEYFFLTREQFEKDIREDRFAEWALVHGNYYGTSKAVIERSFQDQKSVLLDIDVQGAESLRKAFPKEAVLIFIAPPSLEVLEQRLRSRGTDSEETIQKRMHNSRIELAKRDIFDHEVVNGTLEQAYAELKNLVAHKLRVEGRQG